MKEIIVNGVTVEVENETAEIYNHFSSKTNTLILLETAVDLLVKLFAVHYIRDIQDYYESDEIKRSNWTQHTANTFFKTCQDMNFLCDFEVENRHDGAVRDNQGNVYLCAEWEIDTNSIFKEKGEIEKLFNTLKKHKKASAMLFTYKIESGFIEFADKVYQKWNSLHDEGEDYNLYLLTALFKKGESGRVNYFYGIRILQFGNSTIDIWEDYV